MEVIHQQEVTAVNIGAVQTVSFRMSDDAAFYQNFAANLYSYPYIASLREPICNAWDSHIVSENQEQPIYIIIDSNNITIRDFGKGIKDDEFSDIYGIFGGSTKQKSVNQTGGFGLGCKAPWAVVDNFQVTSFNEGKATLYSLSKTNPEDGKPAITKLISYDTQETGLMVQIPRRPFKGSNYGHIIKSLVFSGGINARYISTEEVISDFSKEALEQLDSQLLPTYKDSPSYEKFKDIFVICSDYISSEQPPNIKSKVAIKYGAMVYPFDASSVTSDGKKARILEDRLDEITKRSSRNNIVVFEMKPNTISIAPSREGLVYNEYTNSNIIRQINTILDKVEKEWTNQKLSDFYSKIRGYSIANKTRISLLSSCYKNFLDKIYPDNPEYESRLFTVFLACKNNFRIFNGIIPFTDTPGQHSYFSYYHEICDILSLDLKDRGQFKNTKFLDQIKPNKNLKLRFSEVAKIYVKTLNQRIYDIMSIGLTPLVYDAREEIVESLDNLYKKQFSNVHSNIGVLSNDIVVCHRNFNKQNLVDFLGIDSLDFLNRFSYTVKVSRKQGLVEQVVKDLESKGFNVIHLYKTQTIKPRESTSPKTDSCRPKKDIYSVIISNFNKKEGYLASSNFNSDLNHPSLLKFSETNKPIKTKNPEFVCYFPITAVRTFNMSMERLTDHFIFNKNSKGAFALNKSQYDSMIEDGIPSFEEWVLNKLKEHFKSNAFLNNFILLNFGSFSSYFRNIEHIYYEDRKAYKFLMKNDYASKMFKFPKIDKRGFHAKSEIYFLFLALQMYKYSDIKFFNEMGILIEKHQTYKTIKDSISKLRKYCKSQKAFSDCFIYTLQEDVFDTKVRQKFLREFFKSYKESK